MTGLEANLRACGFVMDALCAVCVVACVLSLADGSPWWSCLFAALAVATFEAGAE